MCPISQKEKIMEQYKIQFSVFAIWVGLYFSLFNYIFISFREFINDQAIGHYPEDILYEVKLMQEYFDTLIPRPTNR